MKKIGQSLIVFVKSLRESARRYFRWILVGIKHSHEAVPVYSNAPATGINVHIGAGLINLQGWINIDARKFSHIHIEANDLELRMFSDGVIQQVYLCHVFEHFSYTDAMNILNILFKKLSPGGRIIISVPDFSKIVDVFCECDNDISVIRDALMGGQNYEYNFHKSMFTKKLLSDYLTAAGYHLVDEWTAKNMFGADLDDWSSRQIPTPKGSRFVSLNVVALKPNL
jgi:predicted SAM-dependent methyltransferase